LSNAVNAKELKPKTALNIIMIKTTKVDKQPLSKTTLGELDLIKVKRVYDEPAESDGFRVLVDRLWPSGLSKDKARVDLWLRDIALSNELRKCFAHDPKKWDEFKRRYFEELNDKKKLIESILNKARKGVVSLLYGIKEDRFNNAIALGEYIENRTG